MCLGERPKIRLLFYGVWYHVVWLMFTHIPKKCASSIYLKMESVSSFRMSINIYQTTWHHTPEDSSLHSHCQKNFSLENWCRGSAYLDAFMKVCHFSNGLMCNHWRRKDLVGSGALLLPPAWKWNHIGIVRSQHTFLPLPPLLITPLLASFLSYTGFCTCP